MNAHPPFPSTPVQRAPAPKTNLGAADRFTGRYLRTFAEFEFWVVGRLNKAALEVKATQPVGQRIKALRAAIKTHPQIVRAPDEVDKLLDRLRPYVQLRSLLAHARLTALNGADESIYLFETPTPLGDDPGKVRTALRRNEFEPLHRGLNALVESFRQQTPDAKPSTSL